MQANLLVSQKIDKELRQRYPAIDREILEIKTGINETLVRFKNGSIIQVCVASENSRGYFFNFFIKMIYFIYFLI